MRLNGGDTDREVTGNSLISMVADTTHFVFQFKFDWRQVDLSCKLAAMGMHEKTLLSAAHR